MRSDASCFVSPSLCHVEAAAVWAFWMDEVARMALRMAMSALASVVFASSSVTLSGAARIGILPPLMRSESTCSPIIWALSPARALVALTDTSPVIIAIAAALKVKEEVVAAVVVFVFILLFVSIVCFFVAVLQLQQCSPFIEPIRPRAVR